MEPENNKIDNKKISESIDNKSDSELIQERGKNFVDFLKKRQIWVLGFLIIALILGIYIRSMPMQAHGKNPGLWDITTNTWTLGPDLDPWLFLRYAKTIVKQGSLPKIDYMRNVPLGFKTARETNLLSYMIVATYYIFNFFSRINIEFAGVVFPVIMFVFTIIAFFLFVREIFIRKSKTSILNANLIAIISTFFMIVIPSFLPRTIAGIPEKESAGFFFMFLTFYLFLKAWKSKKLKSAVILGVFSGISTALMGLIWGGVIYIFVTIAVATLAAFILDKIKLKEFLVYSSWILFSFALIILFSVRATTKGMLTSIDSGLSFIVFIIILIDFIIWSTKISQIKILQKIKIPKNIISFIFAITLILIASLILFGPSFIFEKLKIIHQMIFKPIYGRWNITVAENRQPYFVEWRSNFGPFIKGIPILFWLFFAGSVVLFKKTLNKIKQKDSWILTGSYVLLLSGIMFSRYSNSSVFNGENFMSKLFYYISILIFTGFLIYYYIQYNKKRDRGFEKINYEFLFLFSLFMLCLFTARGAVRLIMVLATIAPIFVGFLVVESIQKFRKTKEEIWKIILGVFVIIILISSIFAFYNFYNTIKIQAYNMVPSYYNQQWQKAMDWVREETPKNAVFAHWWDYGYWVQSIGNRATVLDGGNSITYWNYLMGRLVLTGDNQRDSLEFLYNHNSTYLLIDSSDIGKYGAFSSIGSDKNFDRYSWIGVFLLDNSQTKETKNQTIFIYPGGNALDEDMIINENERKILLPEKRAGIGAIVLPFEKTNNTEGKFLQPHMIVVYQGRQHNVYLRYLYINGKFVDFKSGIKAAAYVIPRLIPQGQNVNSNKIGAIMYLSPKWMRGYLAQKYFLNDPFNKFPNFKLVHSQSNFIIENLNNQGMNLPEFVYYNGIQGPIKIWKIEYTGTEQIKQEYLDKDPTKYIDWEL